MKAINKLILNVAEQPQTFSLKKGHRIVRVEYLVTEKQIAVWVESPLKADIPELQKSFVVRKTNQPVPDEYTYVSSAIDMLAPEGFHIFELPQEELGNNPVIQMQQPNLKGHLAA